LLARRGGQTSHSGPLVDATAPALGRTLLSVSPASCERPAGCRWRLRVDLSLVAGVELRALDRRQQSRSAIAMAVPVGRLLKTVGARAAMNAI